MSAAEQEAHAPNTQAPAAPPSPHEGDAFFERLCQSLSYALIATDENLSIRFWNSTATQMFAYRSELAPGQLLLELFPDSARAPIAEIIHTAIHHGAPGDLEFTQTGPGGKSQLMTAV